MPAGSAKDKNEDWGATIAVGGVPPRGLKAVTTPLLNLSSLLLAVGARPRAASGRVVLNGEANSVIAPIWRMQRRRAMCCCLLALPQSTWSFAAQDLVTTYQSWLQTAPLLTKAATSSFFFGAGDLLAQTIDEDTDEVALGRVARFAGTGFGNGIAWSCWYGFADELLAPVSLPALRVAGAMAIEQFVWCPILFSVYIIPLSSLLNGAPAADLPGEVRKRIGPLLIANAKVWTPANLIIYNVPVEYRVLASNSIDLVWAVICSQTAAECGSDDGCLVSTPNVVLGEDGCALPYDADEEERDLLGLERAPGAALRGPLEDMEKVQRRGE